MIKGKVKICGKVVGVGFCPAASIAFYNYTGGVSVPQYLQELKDGKQDPSKALRLIMAAVFAYHDESGEELPVVDKDLIYGMRFQEATAAFAKVLEMVNEYYTLPPNEQSEADDEKTEGKN